MFVCKEVCSIPIVSVFGRFSSEGKLIPWDSWTIGSCTSERRPLRSFQPLEAFRRKIAVWASPRPRPFGEWFWKYVSQISMFCVVLIKRVSQLIKKSLRLTPEMASQLIRAKELLVTAPTRVPFLVLMFFSHLPSQRLVVFIFFGTVKTSAHTTLFSWWHEPRTFARSCVCTTFFSGSSTFLVM